MVRKKVDITGQRFGKWIALYDTGKRDRWRNRIWRCACDCGETKDVNQASLRGGKSKSCGCSNKVNLTGERFGDVTVLFETDERRNGGNIVWTCECICGNRITATAANLNRGSVTSCGCGRRLDLTGERFGRLTVLRDTGKRQHRSVIWECICECGEKKEVSSNSLRQNNTKSCGCLHENNIIGERFGRLIVLGYSDNRGNNNEKMCKCVCDCGEEKEIRHADLVSTKTKSCGCLHLERLKELSGEKHPFYNSALSDEYRSKHRYELYGVNSGKWRKKVFSFDNYTCQSCNQRGSTLNAHHLNGWNAFPEQRFDTANGITLCEDCHKEFHHFNGYGDNSLEEFRDHIACIIGEEHVSEIEETLLSRESEIIGQETRELQTT